MIIRTTVVAAFLLLAIPGCSKEPAKPPELEAARAKAEQLLALWRSQQWAKATEYVYVDQAVLSRYALPADAPEAVIDSHLRSYFQQLYGKQLPGSITDIRGDPESSTITKRVVVTYIHGDFDTFHLRLVNGEWLYSLD